MLGLGTYKKLITLKSINQPINVIKFIYMKHTLFVFILFVSQTLFGQGNIPQPTRYFSKQSNSSATPLANYERCYYFRHPNGLEYQFQTDVWDGTDYKRTRSSFSTYDANNQLIERRFRQWDAVAGYKDTDRTTYSYDANGNTLTETSESVNATTGAWEIQRTVTNTYSATNKVLERIAAFYTNGQQIAGNKQQTTYDAADRPDVVVMSNYSNGNFVNQTRQTNIYADPDSKVDILIMDTWSQAMNAWTPAQRSNYQYQPTTTTVTYSNWVNGNWEMKASRTIVYNANNQVVSDINYNFVAPNLVPSSGLEMVYNADQSISQFRYYYTDFSTQVYFQSLQIDYDYGTYTHTRTAVLDAKVNVFPNPATDFLQIQIEDATENMEYFVTNVQGQRVTQGQITGGSGQVDCQNLSSGVYMITLLQNGKIKTVPFVKE
jgi:YD repeat-containing protein